MIIGGMWGIAAAGLSWYFLVLAKQITYVTLADGRRQERQLPLLFKALLPLAPNFEGIFSRDVFATTRQKINRKLSSGGVDGLITDTELLSLKIIMPIIIGIPWILITLRIIPSADKPIMATLRVLLIIAGPCFFFIAPDNWLKKCLTTRHNSIRRSLPFVLDLLTLSVEAGMDFMTALQRHIDRSTITPFTEELIRVVREIQLGKTRREALRDMATRVNLTPLTSVVNALVQADELGVSIGTILRIQSDQIRQRRFERAEKLANEAPVKMLGPLVLFIFPAVILILLGPLMLQFLEQLL